MKKVFITGFSSLSALGIGNNETIRNISFQKQPIYFPKENEKYFRPYFPVNTEFNINNVRCSEFALKLLELIEEKWLPVSPLSIFISTSTGGIQEQENEYED